MANRVRPNIAAIIIVLHIFSCNQGKVIKFCNPTERCKPKLKKSVTKQCYKKVIITTRVYQIECGGPSIVLRKLWNLRFPGSLLEYGSICWDPCRHQMGTDGKEDICEVGLRTWSWESWVISSGGFRKLYDIINHLIGAKRLWN